MTLDELEDEADTLGYRLVKRMGAKGKLTRTQAVILDRLSSGPASTAALVQHAEIAGNATLKVHINHIRNKLPKGMEINFHRRERVYQLEDRRP